MLHNHIEQNNNHIGQDKHIDQDVQKLKIAFDSGEKQFDLALDNGKFFIAALLKFTEEKARDLNAKQIQKIKSIVESRGKRIDLASLATNNKQFAMSILKNFKNWSSIIEDQTEFLKNLSDSSIEVKIYINEHKNLLKIKNLNPKEFDINPKTKTGLLDKSVVIALFGEPKAGTTSFIQRYDTDNFESAKIKISSSYITKSIQLGDQTIQLTIWDDSAHQNGRKNYPIDVGIILFDLTDTEDLKSLSEMITNHNKPPVKLILVGTKNDLIDERTVDYDDALQLANSFNIPYFEVSAKTGVNFDAVFETAAKLVLNYKLESDNEFPIPNNLQDMNKLFENLFDLRKADDCQKKSYYDKYLDILRDEAIKLILDQCKEVKNDNSAKKQILDDALQLSIINKHLYMNKGARFVNFGRDNTTSVRFAKWRDELAKEIAKDVIIGKPTNYRKNG